jgi:signal transduction histidine kinase/ligand-binding sensor domain-containing protein
VFDRGGPGRCSAALLAVTWLLLARPAAALEPGQRFDQYAHAAWPSVAHASTVHAILPAGDGTLWVGTSEGLVRLDGERMTPFDSQRLPGIVDRNVRALYQTREGDLWVGAFSGGLSRLRGPTLQTWKAGAAPGGHAFGFLQTADGTFWAGGREGVVRFSPGGDPERLLPIAGLPSRCTHLFAQDAAGLVWAGTHAGLARWNGRAWEPEPGPPTAAVAPVAIDALSADPDGTLWVGTRGAGLWQRRAGVWRIFTAADGLGSNRVSALLRDRGGHLWVATGGTDQGTLAWLERAPTGDRFRTFPLRPHMCPDRIAALAEDGEGGLWIGTELCGLHRLADRPFFRLTTEDGLPSDLVLGLSAQPDGAVAGTRGAGLARLVDGRLQPLRCPPGLPCASCWDFSATGPAGFLTVCSTNVVLRWQGGAMETFRPLPGGLPEASFVLQARDGALWLAQAEKVIRSHGQVAAAIGAGERLQGARILYEGQGGTIWIGAADGLQRWRDGQTRTVRLPSADRPAEVASFHEDREGTLWMGTKGEGIRRLPRDGDRIATVGVGQGLPTGWIVQLLEDGQGRLWASSSKGIFWVNKQELAAVADGKSARVQPSLYDASDGIQMSSHSFGHPAGFTDPQGKLWFATNSGITVVDPRSPALQTPPPRVIVEQARLGGRLLDLAPGGEAVASGASSDLDLQFRAGTFAPTDKVSFRYQLRGGRSETGRESDGWVDLGSGRSLHHARLTPGRYRLAIQARTRDSAWSREPTRLAFTLRPPFHRSSGFVVVCALAAALMLLLAHRMRLSRSRAKMQAVMHERARIARDIHDTLAQAFVATSMQLECLEQALENEDRQTVRHHLDTAKTVVQETLDEARRSLWVLRPQALEHGLVPALRTLVERLSGSPAVALELNGPPRRLPTLTEANLLRIAGEAIANACRHARARHIWLRLEFAARSVILAVTDDGTGSLAPLAAGPTVEQGLTGMQERAADVGGTFAIDSAPDRGTTVRVEVPA